MDIGTRVPVGSSAVIAQFITGLVIPKPLKCVLRAADLCFWIGRRINTLEALEAHPHLALIGLYLDERFKKNDFMEVACQIILVARVLANLGNDIGDFTRAAELVKESFRPAPLGRACFAEEVTGRDWRRVEEEFPRFVHFPWLAVRICERCRNIFKQIGSTMCGTLKITHRILELRESIYNTAPEGVLSIAPIAAWEMARSFNGRERDLIAQMREHEQLINRICAVTNPAWTADRLVVNIERFSTVVQVVNSALNAPEQIRDKIVLGLNDE
jgi:hypothetical protein